MVRVNFTSKEREYSSANPLMEIRPIADQTRFIRPLWGFSKISQNPEIIRHRIAEKPYIAFI
jgi:hypothetical protein